MGTMVRGCRRRWIGRFSIGRVAIILMSGVAPVNEIIPCSHNLKSGTPPTQAEWNAELSQAQAIQVHHLSSRILILEQPLWTKEEVIGLERGPGAKSLAIPWNEITRLDKSKGNKARLGVGLGVGTGLVAGLIAGVICAESDNEDGQEIEADCAPVTLTTALIAVPVGALTGWLIGSRRTKWQAVYCFDEGGQR